MKKFSIIPEKIFKKIEIELVNADIKISVNKLLLNGLIISFVLSIIILLFFRNQLKIAPNFTSALITYYFTSLLIAFLIVIFFIYSGILLRKNKRKKSIENVLADYLQLVATNLNAGMTIDQAMWYSVRERYDIISNEVEEIAKKVVSGEDLETALVDFANKYDSDILKRSMMLLIEGLKSGGELATLVNKISWNIKETQILEKEISAETTTYTIFIIAVSVIISPALYSLSHRIIIVMANILGKTSFQNISGVTSNLPLSFSAGNIISPSDFKIFIFINLAVTSILSALIVALIRKGNIKPGLRMIPIFIAVSFVLFLLISIVLTSAFKIAGL